MVFGVVYVPTVPRRLAFADALLQGRARPSRRVVRAPSWYNCDAVTDSILQMDTSDEDDDEDAVNNGSRRKRQKTSGAASCTYPTALPT